MISFAYGTQTAIDKQAVTEGRMSVTTDTQRLSFDLGGKRINIKGLTQDQADQLNVNTSVRVSSTEPTQKYCAGDVWLVIDG